MEGALRRTLNLAKPDDVYNALVDAHKGLSDEECRAFDARLILLLVNHIGDEAVIREALKEAATYEGHADSAALALVTGGGPGNGAAIARGLAAAGAEVIVTDIDKDAARTIADLDRGRRRQGARLRARRHRRGRLPQARAGPRRCWSGRSASWSTTPASSCAATWSPPTAASAGTRPWR